MILYLCSCPHQPFACSYLAAVGSPWLPFFPLWLAVGARWRSLTAGLVARAASRSVINPRSVSESPGPVSEGGRGPSGKRAQRSGFSAMTLFDQDSGRRKKKGLFLGVEACVDTKAKADRHRVKFRERQVHLKVILVWLKHIVVGLFLQSGRGYYSLNSNLKLACVVFGCISWW